MVQFLKQQLLLLVAGLVGEILKLLVEPGQVGSELATLWVINAARFSKSHLDYFIKKSNKQDKTNISCYERESSPKRSHSLSCWTKLEQQSPFRRHFLDRLATAPRQGREAPKLQLSTPAARYRTPLYFFVVAAVLLVLSHSTVKLACCFQSKNADNLLLQNAVLNESAGTGLLFPRWVEGARALLGMDSSASPSNLLVMVIDCHPVYWGRRAGRAESLDFNNCLNSLSVFANTHLLMDHRNSLAVVACHVECSRVLFPPPGSIVTQSTTLNSAVSTAGAADGRFEHFQCTNVTVKEELKRLAAHCAQPPVDEKKLGSICLAGGLTQALCYIQRATRLCPAGTELKSRIFVLQASPDCPQQYMDIMNCIFAAQKASVPIDSCMIDHDSGFLQQASDITSGQYLRVTQPAGLLEYLMWVFLPDQKARKSLEMPPPSHVDYRAACFCHRQLVDVGFVCSVCLSIFCQFTPICQTCQSHFRVPGLPSKKKKVAS